MTYTTADIRNLALIGHAGAGKTLLAEALLHRAGATRAMGDIARGTTVCDFDPFEKEIGHSLDVAVCHFDYQGRHVNLLDTPGYLDLLGRSQAVLPAVETAVLVVDAQYGPGIGTRRMMECATARALDRIIVVNKIDQPGVDLPALLAGLREAYGPECLPINLPAQGGTRVADCFFSRASRIAAREAPHTTASRSITKVAWHNRCGRSARRCNPSGAFSVSPITASETPAKAAAGSSAAAASAALSS